jgi:predicted RNase H-like HicB family nuclease
MKYTVMLREQSPGYFVAVAPAVPECRAEGKTREETLALLRAQLEAWLQQTEVTSIEISTGQTSPAAEPNPWLATAGIFADDPALMPLMDAIYAERAAEGLAA